MKRGGRGDDRKALLLLDNYVGTPKNQPARLSLTYRFAIASCEALPENQSGCDKTWVEQSRRQFEKHYTHARRVR